MLSPTKPRDPQDEQRIRGIVDEMYEIFVDVVAAGRRHRMSRAQVEALADGSLYSARQAHESGLVDGIKNEVEVVADLQRDGAVGKAQVIELRRMPSLMEALLGVRTHPPTLEGAAAELLRATTGPRLLYWWPGAR
jgi:protease-4